MEIVNIKIRKLKGENEVDVFTLTKGALTIQINKQEALLIASMLAKYCDMRVVEEIKINLLKKRANLHSTRNKPLGI